MPRITRSAFTLALILLLLLVSAQAQTPRMATVNITPDADRVRISTVGDAYDMRVEVSDEQGDVVFQSGQITGHQLDWKMTDSQGERVRAGNYLVTVSFRASNGKLRKRVEQITVDEAEEASTPQAPSAPSASAASVPVQTSGTVTANKIPKFASITASLATVTNSVITESAGKVGIGIAAPPAPLTIVGNWNGQDGALRLNGDRPTIRFAGTEVSGNASWILHQGNNGPGNLEFFRRTGSTWGQVMSLTTAGNVGIGTPYPTGNLHIQSPASFTSLKLTAGSGAGANAGSWRVQADDGLSGQGSAFVIYSDTAQQYRMVINGQGNVGIGTSNPYYRLSVKTDSGDGVHSSSDNGSGVYGSSDTGSGVEAFSIGGESLKVGGSVNVRNLVVGYKNGIRAFHISPQGSYVAGSDFAEALPARGGKAQYEPGDVLIFSSTASGTVEKSTRPFDARVAGIYSTRPGVIGAEKGGESRVDPNDLPVAVAGIVPTKVSAENGAIRVGDLLTTSSTPGYAMRCKESRRCVGAILGKAVEPLREGQGVVKVLVMLR